MAKVVSLGSDLNLAKSWESCSQSCVLLLLRYVVLPSSESTTSSPVAGTYRPLMVACGAQAS